MKNSLHFDDDLEKLVQFICSYDCNDEVWRQVPDSDGLYFISNKGQVLSLHRQRPLLLKQFYVDGYPCVSMRLNGKRKTSTSVSRTVAAAFIEDFEKCHVVHHIDTNRCNNDLTNLLPLTQQEHIDVHRLIRSRDNDIDGS